MFGDAQLIFEDEFTLCEWYGPDRIYKIGNVERGRVKPNEDRSDESTRPDDRVFHLQGRTFQIQYFHGGIPGNAIEIGA